MKKVLIALAAAYISFSLYYQNHRINKIEDQIDEIHEFIIKKNDRVTHTSAEFDCLARNIYWEAGIEAIEGKYAVAQVTINRLKSGRWGKDICSVVYSHAQFSWTLFKQFRWTRPPENQMWADAQQVAQEVLAGTQVPTLNTAMWYHADYIKAPNWAKTVVKKQQIGRHIFYASN
jgi:spore germination cell wall hydrolase CwlJ-like protein